MMPRFIPASVLRARTENRRDERAALENRVIEKPRTLAEMVWTVEDSRVTWNGLDLSGDDEFMSRGFRVVPGPLPGRYLAHSSIQAGRSAEIRARLRLASDVLFTAIAFDIGLSNALFPPAPLQGLELIEFARRQTEEIKATVNSLFHLFAEEFWTRLDGRAKVVTFSALDVVEWIDAQTERFLARDGQWPGWVLMPELAVAT